MSDALKFGATCTAENWSARTFKVSNFKMPESGVIDVSTKERKGIQDEEVRTDKTKRN